MTLPLPLMLTQQPNIWTDHTCQIMRWVRIEYGISGLRGCRHNQLYHENHKTIGKPNSNVKPIVSAKNRGRRGKWDLKIHTGTEFPSFSGAGIDISKNHLEMKYDIFFQILNFQVQQEDIDITL